jgi:predicted DNA-binding transcriptional regulator AlpA
MELFCIHIESKWTLSNLSCLQLAMTVAENEKAMIQLYKIHKTWRNVMLQNISENSLLRLPQVLVLIPISRSAWWAGCKSGRFPKPVKLGPRTTAWRASDIAALLESIAGKKEEKNDSGRRRFYPPGFRPSLPHSCRNRRLCQGQALTRRFAALDIRRLDSGLKSMRAMDEDASGGGSEQRYITQKQRQKPQSQRQKLLSRFLFITLPFFQAL